jgi:hypothetical protein
VKFEEEMVKTIEDKIASDNEVDDPIVLTVYDPDDKRNQIQRVFMNYFPKVR